MKPVEPGVEQTQYYAQDVIRHSSSAGDFYIDLSTNMESSDNTSVALSGIKALNSDSDCTVVSQNRVGFTIKGSGTKVCDYLYRVGPATSGTATSSLSYTEGTVRAIIGNSSELLVPISAVTSSGTSVVIDVKNSLAASGTVIEQNFTLSPIVTLPNASNTNSVVIANSSDDTIEYFPGSGIDSGVERLLYSYSDQEGNILSGTIDIAVSTPSNRAPIAKSGVLDEVIDLETGEVRKTVPWNKEVEIDVYSLIEDDDEDELQLIDVFVYGATATISQSEENPFNGTVFHFSTTESGKKNISYTVSDLKGGFATGVIEVTVDGPYENIDEFTPPHTAQQASEFNAQFEPNGPGDGKTSLSNMINATFNAETANSVCSVQGRFLPNYWQLQSLYRAHPSGELFTKYNWPINLPYLTTDGQAVNMLNGELIDNPVGNMYVSCSHLAKEAKSVELYNRTELESNVIKGTRQTPLLKVTYIDDEFEIITSNDYEIADLSIAQVSSQDIIATDIGSTEVIVRYQDFSVSYKLTVVDIDLLLMGGWIASVGVEQTISMGYRSDVNSDYTKVELDSLKADDDSIISLKKKGDNYIAKGLSEGLTRLTAVTTINGYEYSISQDITVIVGDVCKNTAYVVETQQETCLEYSYYTAKILNDIAYWVTSAFVVVSRDNHAIFCNRLGMEMGTLSTKGEYTVTSRDNIPMVVGKSEAWIVRTIGDEKSYYHPVTWPDGNASTYAYLNTKKQMPTTQAFPFCTVQKESGISIKGVLK